VLKLINVTCENQPAEVFNILNIYSLQGEEEESDSESPNDVEGEEKKDDTDTEKDGPEKSNNQSDIRVVEKKPTEAFDEDNTSDEEVL